MKDLSIALHFSIKIIINITVELKWDNVEIQIPYCNSIICISEQPIPVEQTYSLVQNIINILLESIWTKLLLTSLWRVLALKRNFRITIPSNTKSTKETKSYSLFQKCYHCLGEEY